MSTRKHPIVFYDVFYDEFRPVSQDLVDNLMATSQAYGLLRKALHELLISEESAIGGIKTKVSNKQVKKAVLSIMEETQARLLSNLKPLPLPPEDPAP